MRKFIMNLTLRFNPSWSSISKPSKFMWTSEPSITWLPCPSNIWRKKNMELDFCHFTNNCSHYQSVNQQNISKAVNNKLIMYKSLNSYVNSQTDWYTSNLSSLIMQPGISWLAKIDGRVLTTSIHPGLTDTQKEKSK